MKRKTALEKMHQGHIADGSPGFNPLAFIILVLPQIILFLVLDDYGLFQPIRDFLQSSLLFWVSAVALGIFVHFCFWNIAYRWPAAVARVVGSLYAMLIGAFAYHFSEANLLITAGSTAATYFLITKFVFWYVDESLPLA